MTDLLTITRSRQGRTTVTTLATTASGASVTPTGPHFRGATTHRRRVIDATRTVVRWTPLRPSDRPDLRSSRTAGDPRHGDARSGGNGPNHWRLLCGGRDQGSGTTVLDEAWST